MRRGAGLVEHEQVPRVGVGVEQAVDEDLLGVGARQDLEHGARRDPQAGQARAVVDAHGGRVAHRQHAARGVARQHARHHHARVVRQIRCDLGRHARLAREVELLVQARGEFGEEPLAIDGAATAREEARGGAAPRPGRRAARPRATGTGP